MRQGLDDGPEKFAANAALVVETLSAPAGFALGYDERSLEYVDGYLERMRAGADEGLRRALLAALGSYLGECIRRTYGGRWTLRDGSWAVQFDAGNAAFPFSKTAKQLDEGHAGGQSILGFFSSIPRLMKLGDGPAS